MAAYAAIVPFKRDLWMRIHYGEVVYEAQVLGKMISAYKELESFQDFLERLDSKMREKMSASLRQVADAIRISRKEDDDLDLLMEILKLVRELFHKYYLLEDDKESGATSRSRVVSKSKRVGLSDFWIQLKEELLAPFSRESVFHTLSLVGMPGIGKTSLAREIFEDLDVIEWFDCRVWLTVGVEWKWLEITQSILAQVECPEIHKGGEEIDILLKECLKDKRFLIVLDDVWNGMAHDYLKICLPDTKNGSQILLTTRSKIVAGPISLEVRLLNEEESWLLLRDRAFNGQMWPSQLEKVGKKIAKKCDGLPLTIVTVADLLSKAEESLWIDVATKKKHQIFTEAYDKISEVQYPSYEYLNIQDKACFLYMGLFPLKSNIPGSKLINLWIAEDMIQLQGDRNLELIGALTVFFLKSQSLVMVHQISSGLLSSKPFHGIKTCGLHSSWWHFCQKEARKIKFFHVLDCFDDAFEEGLQSQGWLSIHNNVLLAFKDVHHSIEENCAFTAVTLLCFGPYNQYMVPMCFGLKFLERLDALNIRFYDFPLEILELIELRYLSLTCNGVLPSSISNLGELMYLIVHRHSTIKSYRARSCLPMEIWDMKKLKYLHVMGCDLPNIGDHTSLPELTTLLDVTTRSCNVLKGVSNLKKLGIRIELTPDHFTHSTCCFDHISHASELESLKCVIVNPEYKFQVAPFPCIPISLRKLSLSGLGYPWEEVNKIALLPNLETLKIRYNAFRGSTWEVGETGFPKLQHLQIEDIDLVKLKFARESFKCLITLRIKHCYKLQELQFGNKSIRHIDVIDCNPLIERRIKENAVSGGMLPTMLDIHYSWQPENHKV